MNKAQLLDQLASESPTATVDQKVMGSFLLESLTRFQWLFNQDLLWITPKDYAKFHGISEKTVHRSIADGRISVKNGGLASGSDKPKARKRVHKFFDIDLGRIHIPL